MCAYFIDGDGGGEGESFEGGFFVVDFTEFFVDEVISKDTQVDDFGADRYFFDEFRENIYR